MASGATAVVGLGITEMGKVYGPSATDFAAQAIALALEDAGLQKGEVDGLLIHANLSPEMNAQLQLTLGFEDLQVLNAMSAFGSTSAAML
jgi:acetyl-CoA acetyltransferase